MKGTNGQGIPTGGTTGQVLKKKTGTDYDVEWADESCVSDPLANKNILLVGDSLMSGTGWSGGFGNCLEEQHPLANFTNVAVSGATISEIENHNWIFNQLWDNLSGKDILIFNGGFNDLGSSVQIGSVPENIEPIESPTTIIDCFCYALNYARSTYPLLDIFYILPTIFPADQFSGISASTANELSDKLKTACGYYSVGVIDLRNSNVFTPMYLGSAANPYMYDYLHYNEAGYRKMASYINNEICKYYV